MCSNLYCFIMTYLRLGLSFCRKAINLFLSSLFSSPIYINNMISSVRDFLSWLLDDLFPTNEPGLRPPPDLNIKTWSTYTHTPLIDVYTVPPKSKTLGFEVVRTFACHMGKGFSNKQSVKSDVGNTFLTFEVKNPRVVIQWAYWSTQL